MFNRDLQAAGGAALRKPITVDVIQVADTVTTLDPVIEASEVQRMINSHNAQTKDKKMLELKRTVYFTGYLLNPTDTAKLLTLVKTPQNMHESDIKFLSNNILITFGPAPEHILTKVGGMGYKQTWQVTAFGTFENKVWAARVAPVPPISVYHTDNNVPFILLAHHRGRGLMMLTGYKVGSLSVRTNSTSFRQLSGKKSNCESSLRQKAKASTTVSSIATAEITKGSTVPHQDRNRTTGHTATTRIEDLAAPMAVTGAVIRTEAAAVAVAEAEVTIIVEADEGWVWERRRW